MTEQIRLRINRELVKEADQVCRELGITPTAAVSMFFAQMVKLRGLPFRPGGFPALDEYNVTLAQATTVEDLALAEVAVS
jgi:addiction module RelB/DinJ family antitoxin